MIRKHLDKENLHHAYLIEGEKSRILPDLLGFFADIGINTEGNPDFSKFVLDSFSIEDAFNLRDMACEKCFEGGKKIFIIAVNGLTRDSQGVLLKIFEEPVEGTHFFLVMPDVSALFPTLRSRFYFISADSGEELMKEARWFLSVPLAKRIDFLKEYLEEEDEDITADSGRTKAGKLLNAMETALHESFSEKTAPCFEIMLETRAFLRQQGSSVKSLMESLALNLPVL